MPIAPKDVLAKISTVIQAWSNLRPQKSFSGITLDQFKDAVKPSLDVRAEITESEGRLQSATARREKADEASMDAMRRVVRGVQGDPEEGEDGELYAAMGFVRKSQRGSGLTRRRKNENEKNQEDSSVKENAPA